MLKRRLDDYWNIEGDGDPSDSWRGFTRFTKLDEKPPNGFSWSAVRLTKKQTTFRPDILWPEIWKDMSEATQRKEKQKWAIETAPFMHQHQNSRLHLLFEKNLCGTRFRAFMFERSITTASQPTERFKTACDVTLLALSSAHPLTQTSTGISRDMRRNNVGTSGKVLKSGTQCCSSAAHLGPNHSVWFIG